MTTSGDNIPNGFLPNGESPMCDAYESRLMDLLAFKSGSQTTPDRKATDRR
jgi:hypothetical protein